MTNSQAGGLSVQLRLSRTIEAAQRYWRECADAAQQAKSLRVSLPCGLAARCALLCLGCVPSAIRRSCRAIFEDTM
jgi:hypothetical protein